MAAFTKDDLLWLSVYRDQRYPMARICDLLPTHTRDEVVEAIDALLRCESIEGAMRWVNHVLALQASNVPLINGNPQTVVARMWAHQRVAPQF